MSKQSSSSSSAQVPSFSSGSLFSSGLAQSVDKVSPEVKHDGVATYRVRQRWEIQYGELKQERKLSQGAFGEVWLGTYRKSKVAIKVYDFRGALTSEQQAAVLLEADLMEGLRSEYLVGFRGICLDPRYCLVMEYCEGGTLRGRLDRTSEAITPLEQLRWAMQISYGLYQLHSVKIIHRDLKGENILLDGHGHAKVADFGLSVVKSSSASQSKKGAGFGAAGTIPWMAPELFDNQPNSMETDAFSLGTVLWEIISRKIPFEGRMVAAIMGMIMIGKREELPKQCPEVFRLMITACWDANPQKRPTAEQVGDQFDAVLKSLESISSQIQSPEQDLKSSVDSFTGSLVSSAIVDEHKIEVSTKLATLPLPQSPAKEKLSAASLQEALVIACEQGDIIKVKAALSDGAKPDEPNAQGKQPLAAAVWGMNPEIVKLLITEMGGASKITWQKIEKHKKEYYYPIWQFEVDDYWCWFSLEQYHEVIIKMESNPFFRTLLIDTYNQLYTETWSWDQFIQQFQLGKKGEMLEPRCYSVVLMITLLKAYRDRRSQIELIISGTEEKPLTKKEIEPLEIKPTLKEKDEEEVKRLLPLQEKLVQACESGDLKAVQLAVSEGASPVYPSVSGKLPLASAVWGMNPEVVTYLISLTESTPCMTWYEILVHNHLFYHEIYLLMSDFFYFFNYTKWYRELLKIEINRNSFLQSIYFEKGVKGDWHKLLSDVRSGYVNYNQTEKDFREKTENPIISDENFKAIYEMFSSKRIGSFQSIPAFLLQALLTWACEMGDEYVAYITLKRGAKADVPDAQGHYPLAAAVYGMNPNVVEMLIRDMEGVAYMNWEEIERHNQLHYGDPWLISVKLTASTYSDLLEFSHKIYLWEQYRYRYYRFFSESMLFKIYSLQEPGNRSMRKKEDPGQVVDLKSYPQVDSIERVYASYRLNIQSIIKRFYKAPSIEWSSEFKRTLDVAQRRIAEENVIKKAKEAEEMKILAPLLQAGLVRACIGGDENAVRDLLRKGAQPNIPAPTGEQALAAAVYGMNPKIVELLIKQNGGVLSISKEEINQHNQRHYGRVWRMSSNIPQSREALQARLDELNFCDQHCFLSLIKKFDYKKSKLEKDFESGYHVILTNDNTVYFIFFGKPVMQDDKQPKMVKGIDRQGISLSLSKHDNFQDNDDSEWHLPQNDAVDKIIQEAKLKGNYIPSKWLEQPYIESFEATYKAMKSSFIPQEDKFSTYVSRLRDATKDIRSGKPVSRSPPPSKDWLGRMLENIPLLPDEKRLVVDPAENQYAQYRTEIKAIIQKATAITPTSSNSQALLPKPKSTKTVSDSGKKELNVVSLT